jgi:hypothetical protein
MKTSEFATLRQAAQAARNASIDEDRIVTLWCDDCDVDEAAKLIAGDEGDWETCDDCIDVWSMSDEPDWRVQIRVLNAVNE